MARVDPAILRRWPGPALCHCQYRSEEACVQGEARSGWEALPLPNKEPHCESLVANAKTDDTFRAPGRLFTKSPRQNEDIQ